MRLKRYQRRAYAEWLRAEPVYGAEGLTVNSWQVMQRWEDNYMRSLAAVAASKGGDVLEVGFGLGISARYIQDRARRVRSHTLIEAHPGIAGHAERMFARQLRSGRLRMLTGFWEDLTPRMPDESFDGILFDTCPLDAPVEFFQFFDFFPEAHRLLRPGGVFTYFSDEPTTLSRRHIVALERAGFRAIRSRVCKVRPPRSCKYWRHGTIVTPIVVKN